MMTKLEFRYFDTIYSLMEESFPSEEYRSYDEQKALLNNPAYTIYVLNNEHQDIMAFIAVWEFDDFAFIEHFAVNPNYRNGGIGARVLNEMVELLSITVCLEVEPPETEMAKRRIGFYKRNKFFLNDYPYMQPSISPGKAAIPLLIMTTGGTVDEATFEQMKDTLYAKVYKSI